ncbi:hypothetical protein V6N12_076487 [Hibiscus sabdariffa]|uniref:Uncharacterized protein n=1 Tax=Hibiscus sabdariffa TaxID=183260 RepID=A0ABR2D9Z1_9ROSI
MSLTRREKRDDEPPFRWATEYRATIHTTNHLLSNHIPMIINEVQYKSARALYQSQLGLEYRSNLRRTVTQAQNSVLEYMEYQYEGCPY